MNVESIEKRCYVAKREVVCSTTGSDDVIPMPNKLPTELRSISFPTNQNRYTYIRTTRNKLNCCKAC